MSEKQYLYYDADGREVRAAECAFIYDPTTNLEWFADFLPQEIRHHDTDAACAEQTLAGGGWRMPTRREADSIIDSDRFNPARDPVFRGPKAGWMWTSTRDPSAPEYGAFYVTLARGYVYLYNRDGAAWVRPCRVRRAPSQ